jgi:hypothetical protein
MLTLRTIGPLRRSLKFIALLLFVSPLACAQQEGETNAVRLPDAILGNWVPVTRSILEFGNLTIEQNSFTWAMCVDVPYRVQRRIDSAVLVELVRSPPCRLVNDAPFWLEVQGKELTVSWCQDANEIAKPVLERSCSWGRLRKAE